MGSWVVFDYGAVLCLPQPEADLRALEAAAGVGPDGADAFWAGYWDSRRAYDAADLSPEDYWTRVLGDRPSADRLAELNRADVAGWSHPEPATLAVVDDLVAAGVGLALLSNAPVTLADAIDDMGWMQVVPHRFYSCRLRAVKPDAAAYRGVLDAIGAEPADVTFVDDRPPNVAGAAALGIRAVHFTDPAALAAELTDLTHPGET